MEAGFGGERGDGGGVPGEGLRGVVAGDFVAVEECGEAIVGAHDEREGGGSAGGAGGGGAEVGAGSAAHGGLDVGGDDTAGAVREGGCGEAAVGDVADEAEGCCIEGGADAGCGEEFHAIATAAFEHDDFEFVPTGGEADGAKVVLRAVEGVVDHDIVAVDADAAAVVGVEAEGVVSGCDDLDEAGAADGILVADACGGRGVVSVSAIGAFAEDVDGGEDDGG